MLVHNPTLYFTLQTCILHVFASVRGYTLRVLKNGASHVQTHTPYDYVLAVFIYHVLVVPEPSSSPS